LNKRILKDGTEVDSYDHPIDLIIHTKAPAKWKLVDMETGEEYLGSMIEHPAYGEKLREKVMICKIGSWFKTRDKNETI
jgi:hypothetical protein